MKNGTLKHFLSGLILASVLIVPSARALDIPADADARIEELHPTFNYGGSSNLAVRSVPGGQRWTYIYFDAAHYVPAGTKPEDISRAWLRIYVTAVAQAGPVSFRQVAPGQTWTEGKADGAVSTSDVRFGAAPGGFAGPILMFSQEHVNTFYAIDVTEWVRSWIAFPQNNNGVILLPDGPSASTPIDITFDAKENTATGHAPTLDITINKVRTTSRGDVTMGGFTNGPTP